jgi:hypothetical protein
MKASQREFTFLVRIWGREGTSGTEWRGSVHEVASGNRRFITGTSDVAEFIAAFLRAEDRVERSPD